MKHKIQDLSPGETVIALQSGPIAVAGASYEVFEIRLRDGYIGLTLLKPNRSVPKSEWSSFDVSGSNLSTMFQPCN